MSVCSRVRKLENQLRKMCKLILVSSWDYEEDSQATLRELGVVRSVEQ